MFYTLSCRPEDFTLHQGGVPYCSNWNFIPVPEQFHIDQLDPVVLGQMFGVGFTLVASVLLIGIGARAVLNFIKNA